MPLSFSKLLLVVLASTSIVSAEKKLETLDLEGKTMNGIFRQQPMPEMGDGRLERILSRYFTEGLGGPEKWESVKSLKVSGNLRTDTGTFDFAAYQKKPNLIKLMIKNKQGTLVLGYDGTTAWKLLPNAAGKAESMDDKAARRFIHSSQFGNHLLYPYEEGKTISYVDTVPLQGGICHQIRVVFDTGYQVDYYLDIRTYDELKVVTTDLSDQSVLSVEYKDFNRDYALPIATSIRTYEDGKFTSELSLSDIKINTGVMPWMFRMPKE